MNKYAVWGNPISQSKSPRIHQLFAQQAGKNIDYSAQLGDSTLFKQQIYDFFQQGAKGANITAPFKEEAFQLADCHSESCLLAEACNTLKLLDNGNLYADNTDGMGLVMDLERLGWLTENQNILILGAGGATKGVLYPLLNRKQTITLYNRTLAKAVTLTQKFAKFGHITTTTLEQLHHQSFDVIINATSLGLQGKYVPLPSHLLQHSKVYDMQYASNMNTPFLRYAIKNGAKQVQDGLGMLVGQAAYSFYLWENIMPEIPPVLQQLKIEI
ncbi:shikimate dehydrogenase [Pasteurella skyensis]|uniref:shikimate dehydrogenase n=1 Tax=Phocoenobacter skyensis TaxID=97481 RepID=UPI002768AAE5|nr:shikimate dehydrogenase [Pasteurella skyensis]MDP8175972.1 shikimate dehydrogenase [Pasteurella skyensis]MDP8198571.1 shikimate dehydrogenase [Pasteurella skyensis]